jgi:hypothetical protein
VVFDPSRGTPPRQAYWKDESYKVGHVTVRSYRLTPLARLLQRVETLPTSTIDESTILGQYLMHACFFHAEEFEMSRKGGRERLHYRISKQRIIDLLADERIRVNAKVLLAALDEDSLGKK